MTPAGPNAARWRRTSRGTSAAPTGRPIQLSALVANRSQNPQAVFGDRLRALNTGNSYMVRPFTTEAVSALRQDVMTRAYAMRFANAADFSFLIVGTFDQAAITPLIEQYIDLPHRAAPEAARLRESGIHVWALIEHTRLVEAEGEMDDHLGYGKHDPAGRDGGNSRNPGGMASSFPSTSAGSSPGSGTVVVTGQTVTRGPPRRHATSRPGLRPTAA